ncbi:hypothetical protein [Streptomyces sp. NPDC006355]|uniref:hypothetical protein n=1 Tax=Streptomyces sp. NPDC006355 TaxID=3156758 RepID=UPI0033B28D79
MTAHPLAAAPAVALPVQRQAAGEEASAAVGPMPWLTDTGRLDQVLTAWGRGQLAEVPAGVAFDVLLTPLTLGRDTVHRMHEAGRPAGPVILGPLGAEFLIERGSAVGWSASHTVLLRAGALVLLPPPGDENRVIGARSWLVPPCRPETGAPLCCAELPPASVLLEPFQAAVQAATARREWPCTR